MLLIDQTSSETLLCFDVDEGSLYINGQDVSEKYNIVRYRIYNSFNDAFITVDPTHIYLLMTTADDGGYDKGDAGTTITLVSTPEPGTMLLLGLGLVGLAGVRRKFKN